MSEKGSAPDVARARSAQDRRRDILTLDLPLVLGLTLCTVLTVVEATRAVGGNARSWAYTFEWPLIGAFICWIWYRYRISVRRVRSRNGDADGGDQPSIEAGKGGDTAFTEARQRAMPMRSPEQADAPGLASIARSITARWRAQVEQAEADYDREHADAERAWREYAQSVQEEDAQSGRRLDDEPPGSTPIGR